MILRVRTTTGNYMVPVKSKLEALKFLQTLHQMGFVCVWWKYEQGEVS